MHTDREAHLFKYFDKYGIKYVSTAHIYGYYFIDQEDYREPWEMEPYQCWEDDIMILAPFHLSQEKLRESIQKYVFQTAGLRLENFMEFFRYPTYNGVPFLLHFNYFEGIPKIQLARKHIIGNLVLSNNTVNKGVIDLGNIERITGELEIRNHSMRSLGNLFKVSRNVCIVDGLGVGLQSLAPLREVGKSLKISSDRLTSLDTVEMVKGDLDIHDSAVVDFGALRHIGGNLILNPNNKTRYNYRKVEIKGDVHYRKPGEFR